MDWIVPLALPMPGMMGSVTCYLVRGPEGWGLIDTGMHNDDTLSTLRRKLSSEGIALGDLQVVVCTHYHADHCGLAGAFQEAGVRVLLSHEDARALEVYFSHPEYDLERSVFYGELDVPSSLEQEVSGTFSYLRQLHAPFVPDGTFGDGDLVSVAGRSLRVLATPGHTGGHVCLVEEQEKAVFLGDHILRDGTVYVGLSRESVVDDVMGQYFESLERLHRLAGWPGYASHGRPVEDVAVRATQVRGFHEARIRLVLAHLGQTADGVWDISRRAFGEKRRPLSKWLAVSQTLSYLEHLVATGRAREYRDGSRRFSI